ncbi:MAG: prepilin-type N-terminal cleavage/methylation domain-containing protein [Phycisphaerales bacterium]|nr:prepilin-type N-terminal cleavage/methylation domain-containing protein [Phycisphaerales bacterium]
MTRRGFTMLEVVMATLIGSLVATTCISLSYALMRTDRSLASRAEQQHDLMIAHLVIQRALGGLVMNKDRDSAPVRPEDIEDPVERARLEAQLADQGDDAPQESGPAPRFVLEADTDFDRLVRRANFASGPRLSSPQRLEVVCNTPPVPPPGPPITLEALPAHLRTPERVAEVKRLQGIFAGTIRGAFELRPEADEDERLHYTLWWIPSAGDAEEMLTTEAAGTPLVADITRCSWEVFKGRERLGQYHATFATELPAYVTLEIETEAGIYANWMFEIGWVSGDETGEDDPAPDMFEGGEEPAPNETRDRLADDRGNVRIPSARTRSTPTDRPTRPATIEGGGS